MGDDFCCKESSLVLTNAVPVWNSVSCCSCPNIARKILSIQRGEIQSPRKYIVRNFFDFYRVCWFELGPHLPRVADMVRKSCVFSNGLCRIWLFLPPLPYLLGVAF